MKHQGLSYSIFIVVSLVLIILSFTKPIHNRGDAWEYIGATISIANHVHPSLVGEDINDRKMYLDSQAIGVLDDRGYLKDRKGAYQVGHFWFYSALCVPVYKVIKWFGANPLKTFTVTNTLFMIIAFWWTMFQSKINTNAKIWLVICLALSPAWFYVAWPHPELFCFVFIFIGMLEFVDNRKVLACLFTSLASLQNPAISLITLFILLYEIYERRNDLMQRLVILKLVYMSIVSLIVFIPYIWYWYHFRIFSLVAKYSTSVNAISFSKVFSLFFDPNFGIILYVPFIFGIFLWLILKRNIACMLWAGLLILMSITCATQYNWNSDMEYINRYSVWMIPIILIGIVPFIAQLKQRTFYTLSLILFVVSLPLFTYYMSNLNDPLNSVKFQPVAKFLLVHAPALYYSPPEVFIERALGSEIPIWDPKSLEANNFLAVVNGQGARKIFVYKNGISGYLNGQISLKSISLQTKLLQ